MSYKKQIITIMTLVILLLLTMSTTIQAASVGKVYNLNATMHGSQIKLTWTSVSGAAGYNIYVNNIRIGSVSKNEAALIGFSDNATYRFKVAAYDSQKREGTLSAEEKLTTTVQQTLGQVRNVTVTQVNGYVTLNWAPVTNADKYQIFVDIPNSGEIEVGEVSTTGAILRGFEEGKRYGFSIRACQTLNTGILNYGEKSTMKYCTVDYDKDDSNYNTDDDFNTSIGTVQNVKVSNITDTEVTVSWGRNTYADGYEVLLSKNYGTYKTVADKSGTTVYLYNLDPDTYYRVKVIPYETVNGKKQYGEESSYKSFTTDEEIDYTPAQVKNVNVSNITEDSAYVSWSSVSNATGYNIYVSKNSGTYKYWGTTTSRNYTINNLDADTSYRVRVEAYRRVNGIKYTGSYSTAKSFRTDKDDYIATVTHLNVTVKNRNEAYLSWWPVEDATGYEVYISEEGSSYERIAWTTDTTTILTSEKLDYATNYRVKVRAYKNVSYSSGNGYYSIRGGFSSVKSFKTEQYNSIQDNPNVAKVTGVKAPVKGTSVYLSWNKVSGAAGYEIDFTVPGIGNVTLYSNTNYREVSGVTGKDYDYTARIRAYKYINGVKVYGLYSDVVKFREN